MLQLSQRNTHNSLRFGFSQSTRKTNILIKHSDISDAALRKMMRAREISFGGNVKLKIYGRLNCKSGKRMKRENRIFFASEEEATGNGYRPCAHCMQVEYKKWKANNL